jgi:hypothetical protein
MSKPGRIPCEVVSCRRTAPAAKYPPGTRIICGKCWRLGPPEARKAYSAADRELTRLVDQKARRIERYVVSERRHEAWQRVLVAASEARAGIG